MHAEIRSTIEAALTAYSLKWALWPNTQKRIDDAIAWLAAQPAETWTPVEDGEYSDVDGTTFHVTFNGQIIEHESGETIAPFPNLRLCHKGA